MRASLIVFLLIIPNAAKGTNWILRKQHSVYDPIYPVPKFSPGGFLKPVPGALPFVHRPFSAIPFRKPFWKPIKGPLRKVPVVRRKPLFWPTRLIFNPLPWKFRKPCKAVWKCRPYKETFSFPKYGRPRVRPFVFPRQLPSIRPRPSFRPVPTMRLAPRINTASIYRPEPVINHHQGYIETSRNGYTENRNVGHNSNNFGSNNNNNNFVNNNNLGNNNNFGNSNLGHNNNNLGNNNFGNINNNNFRNNNNNKFGNSNNNNFRNRNNNNNFGNNNNLGLNSLGNNQVELSTLNSNDFHTHGQDVYVRVQSLNNNANNNLNKNNNNNNNFNGV